MDVNALLADVLDDYEKLNASFADNDVLYRTYKDVIANLLFIDNRDDFIDFIAEQGSIEFKSFLLACAEEQEKCLAFGTFEIIEYDNINDFFGISINQISDQANDIDEMLCRLKQYNDNTRDTEHRLIVLLDEAYGDGTYYIFDVDLDIYAEQWTDASVRRIL